MKYVLSNETHFKIVVSNKREAVLVLADYKEEGWLRCKRIPRRKHACLYCGELTKGRNGELLCEICNRETGHKFYNVLY